MECWFSPCWIFLWMVFVPFRNLSAEPMSTPHYTIHHNKVSFDQAMVECSPGVLTTLATEQEVTNILGLISTSISPPNPNELNFWVGLRKVKNECVVHTRPLRGFKWTEDGSEETKVSRWTEEPKCTCTTVRCAVLKAELDGSTVTRWGLIPVSCKHSYQFICKLRDSLTEGTPKPPKAVTPEAEPATPETKPAAAEPHKPLAAEPPKTATTEPPKPSAAAPSKHDPKTATRKPEPAASEPELPTQRPKPETNLKPQAGSEVQGSDSDPGSEPVLELNSCQQPRIPDARSLSLDPDNSSRIQVECWSSIQLEIHCSGRPAVWRLLDNSPANFTTVCQLCEAGFQKDVSGNCVDIDECSGGSARCRHTCLNTEGSYRCVCSDESGKQQDEGSPVCRDKLTNDDKSLLSGILIPVLVAVAALVVLVVVVVVTVKCCLMRRSKKRAVKKAEKMAMKSKEG